MREFRLIRASIIETIIKYQADLMNKYASYKVKVGIDNVDEKVAAVYQEDMMTLTQFNAACMTSGTMQQLEENIEIYSELMDEEVLARVSKQLHQPSFGFFNMR